MELTGKCSWSSWRLELECIFHVIGFHFLDYVLNLWSHVDTCTTSGICCTRRLSSFCIQLLWWSSLCAFALTALLRFESCASAREKDIFALYSTGSSMFVICCRFVLVSNAAVILRCSRFYRAVLQAISMRTDAIFRFLFSRRAFVFYLWRYVLMLFIRYHVCYVWVLLRVSCEARKCFIDTCRWSSVFDLFFPAGRIGK